MKIFFDCEFTGLHKGTTLISIGMISENGWQFYAELTDFDKDQCDEWIKNNVLENLKFKNSERIYTDVSTSPLSSSRNLYWDCNKEVKGDSLYVRTVLQRWLTQFDEVQLVSDVCHYDFVLFISLFGTAFDLPKHVSPCCHDINQDIGRYYKITDREAFDLSREEIISHELKVSLVEEKHNALYDAKVIREVYQIVNGIKF